MTSPNSSPSFDNLAAMKNLSKDLLNLPGDSEIWESLKQAIASSSGFQRWQLERGTDAQVSNAQENNPQVNGLDALIRRYLRETLETLAY